MLLVQDERLVLKLIKFHQPCAVASEIESGINASEADYSADTNSRSLIGWPIFGDPPDRLLGHAILEIYKRSNWFHL
jgi:hypothetical protein